MVTGGSPRFWMSSVGIGALLSVETLTCNSQIDGRPMRSTRGQTRMWFRAACTQCALAVPLTSVFAMLGV
jgi:hypothetical protein